MQAGNFAIEEKGADQESFGVAGADLQVIVLFPDGHDAHVGELDADSGGAVVFFYHGEFDDQGVALFAGFIGRETLNVIARLVGEEISEGIEDDGVAFVVRDVGFDGLQDVGMMADDGGGTGFEHVVGEIGVAGIGSGGVFDAPVNGDEEKIALGAGGFDFFEDGGLIEAGSAAGIVGVGEESDVGIRILVGIAIAVEPAGHAEPSDFDAVLFEDDGLPGGFSVCACADEEEFLFAEMIEGFEKAGVALVEDVIVREGDDFYAIGFQRLEEGDGSVKLKWLGAAAVLGGDGRFEIDETEVGLAEGVGDLRQENVVAAVEVGCGGFGVGGVGLSGGAGCTVFDGELILCCRGLLHGLVRNDVASGGEVDARQLARVGDRSWDIGYRGAVVPFGGREKGEGRYEKDCSDGQEFFRC